MTTRLEKVQAVGFRRTAVVILVFILFMPLAILEPVRAETGSIDAETANRLVNDYARHVLKQLPRDWRKVEEQKWRSNPPHIPPGGIYQLTSPSGHIAFEHDAEKQQLLCWSKIHKARGEHPTAGLTREEVLDALKRAEAKGVDTGGGEVVWEPVSEGYFLLRTFDHPPKSNRQLSKELDRFVAAAEEWARKHYLAAVQSYKQP